MVVRRDLDICTGSPDHVMEDLSVFNHKGSMSSLSDPSVSDTDGHGLERFERLYNVTNDIADAVRNVRLLCESADDITVAQKTYLDSIGKFLQEQVARHREEKSEWALREMTYKETIARLREEQQTLRQELNKIRSRKWMSWTFS